MPHYTSEKPLLSLLKALLLQQCHGLSSPGLEEAVGDRPSGRRLCGVSPSDTMPDETTFVRFRADPREHGLTDGLFRDLTRRLDTMGLMPKTDTLIDVTLGDVHVERLIDLMKHS